ncbi:MAG: M23 family metallopeptidase [Roseitalea sp.]|uniref:M23 family metallopeptidase n=1 Tax=Oceaniradius stylonematis TaxID=2184161 RepID=UPI000F3C41D1|nr:M23 family metallopeptidase [Oceaniradius stylonematis]MBO6552353.1 M23 family metallopeptidase [Roseitalea sp.]MBO6950727.1 M23 family metallopeptidase [Rhizobiaceae bacterium]RNC95109.1 MAG: M23 family metallopeptidase [Oricola sp.]MBO6591286.1 M23 family metallopeptidase [Roseitalea sp.]MBO6599141.1 M23 family metallopeptidase [Roseitalea sp.]
MIVIAQGDRIRHFTVRPWAVALGASLLLAVAAGYLIATGYLIMRDDLINAAVLRQARVQHAYEDRIASLRAQVDRITSHRLLDQQFMESKIAELATRQSALAERSGTLAPLLERARGRGIGAQAVPADALPVPALRPGADQAALETIVPANPLLAPATRPVRAGLGYAPATRSAASTKADRLGPADPLTALSSVTSTLDEIETAQLEQLGVLARAAHSKRNAIIAAARESGLPIRSETTPLDAVGGPFVPIGDISADESFETGIEALQTALDALERTKSEVTAFPIAHPAPGQRITSGFGPRRDPILGRSAFHAGMDFRAPTGTPIRAPASGKIVRAGRNGGYGKMVEIDHGNGLKTRFAHLSRIQVRVGEEVSAGQRIGASGNTGRSTGPHLHYEVRKDGQAVNPMRYLKAGTRLGSHL